MEAQGFYLSSEFFSSGLSTPYSCNFPPKRCSLVAGCTTLWRAGSVSLWLNTVVRVVPCSWLSNSSHDRTDAGCTCLH
jgi:hypothetical protein